MTIKLYADGAAMDGIIEAAKNPNISGFTTNPTLMRQAGVTDYASFAQSAIEYLIKNRPETNLSLEVFSDEPQEMMRQARMINDWGDREGYSVYVKIPVMHTDGTSTAPIIAALAAEGIKVNVTAVFTFDQIVESLAALTDTPSIISVFVGRINDVGFDVSELMKNALAERKDKKSVEFLWASSRQAYSYVEAQELGFDIITMTPDLIKKVNGFGKDLTQFSRETCQMFYDDAVKSGFKL
jgi:transaldolase